MPITRRTALALAALIPGLPARPALAQGRWSPTQPVRVLIPFPAGGTMDPVVRMAQTALQEDLGQPVVVDYRPGGATVLRLGPDERLTVTDVRGAQAAEVTGAVEEAIPVVLAAIEHGKHVVLKNAELDGTVGPLLRTRADAAGVRPTP
jgi:hypothetical protein